MNFIAPTVGSIVLFSPDVVDSELCRDHAPFAAIIASIREDGRLNLTVFDKQGSTHPRSDVPLIQGTLVADPERAYAMWMEYQRGQAAKSDETVATLVRALNTQAARIDALEAHRTPLLGPLSTTPRTLKVQP